MLQVFGKSDSPASGRACPAKVQGLAGLIGNTPLIRVASLSEATGCEVNASAATPAVMSNALSTVIISLVVDHRLSPLQCPALQHQ